MGGKLKICIFPNDPLIAYYDKGEIKDKYYKDLSPKMKKKFTMYPIDVVTVYDSKNEDEIREMFLRLQNGVTLKSL